MAGVPENGGGVSTGMSGGLTTIFA